MHLRRLACVAALALTVPSPVSAELRRVRIDVPGMDCASCARAMSGAVKKIDGVEAVDLSPEQMSVEIRLRADNRVTLERIRREMRAFGYPTKDAAITARGTIADRDGTAVLDLLNGSTLALTEKPPSPPAGIVEITGTSTFDEKAGERLTIATVK